MGVEPAIGSKSVVGGIRILLKHLVAWGDLCGQAEGHCRSGSLEPASTLVAAIHHLFRGRLCPGRAPAEPAQRYRYRD